MKMLAQVFFAPVILLILIAVGVVAFLLMLVGILLAFLADVFLPESYDKDWNKKEELVLTGLGFGH